MCFTFYIAFIIRFDEKLPEYIHIYFKTLPFLIAIVFGTFIPMRQLSGMWRYYSIHDVWKTVLACFIAILIFSVLIKGEVFYKGSFSRTVLIAEFILLTGWCTGSRAFIRAFREKRRSYILKRREYISRVMICGSSLEADTLIRSCSKHFNGLFCGVFTEETDLAGRSIHGVPIYTGTYESLIQKVKNWDITDLHLLDPYNKPQAINDLLDLAAKAGISPKFRTIPSLKDLASGEISTSMIRDVDVIDLLGRDEAQLDRTKTSVLIKGHKILITGAGGSIGSELCRQILSYEPKLIVLFESSEIALYTIEKELRGQYPKAIIVPIAGDIRYKEEIKAAINKVNGIDLIYHAAAYKHVPLMESNPSAAFRNNVIGTSNLANIAEEMKVKRFVMISSDKAVRPSNIMGSTKRIAERILQEREFKGTEFVAVRFGNVLGSSGSVIPLFKKQIKEGKSITVTSPEMRRFFMTIPEAVDLVLMSGAIAQPSQIMVLEMGEAVKIYDLAVRLIELSGLTPHEDIKIEFCGLRPGEKEYEEILTEDENVIETEYDRIWLMQKDQNKQRGQSIDLNRIKELISINDLQEFKNLIHEYVPENTIK
ncbi:nucleoside-diphosphate sugar epimerase/dehydratase [Lentisphaera profundi]|uniref:Nucleoside-diphosphate sugar epimerase/dehydratase n=1 Tax=Lentisphaera profundi TaxID=1658616 RepID=A0ABY7W0Z6_9BACT|nr:nucleoside-diphosphate sugar epimerase/dehydratase [Lentisphaera profundi]WDE99143.1 nucleoside-diphosphate sugar epimerase/dehydratase [Lentisphaera profundi]